MKTIYNFKKIITITTLLVCLVGCSEYLSELPDNRTVIDSPNKIKKLVTGAYPNHSYMLMAELMSDNAVSKNTSNRVENSLLHEDMFNWKYSSDDNRDTPIAYWTSCYKAIAQANKALEYIEEFKESNLNGVKGEALLARAYAHFMLVNFWGKHYNSNSASKDLGVPYVTEPETVLLKKYKRNTVQEVYNFIEKDLLQGLELVEKRGENDKFHFSKESGYAFATRFYTFKGDWNKVVEYASKVLTSPRDEIRNQNQYRNISYAEQTAQYNSSVERTNLLITSTSSLWARSYSSTNYGLLSDSRVFSSNNPFRKRWAYQVFGGEKYANRPKFDEYFKITNQTAGTGSPYTPSVLFSKDEVLLNRAEAYAMLNNYASSLKDLTDFLSQKTRNFNTATDVLTEQMIIDTFPLVANELTPNYPMDNKQTSFVKAVLDLKQKEFYHEGLRWFDVRRFKIKIDRDFIKDGQTTRITLEKEDKRKQLQIPESAISNGLTPNPR